MNPLVKIYFKAYPWLTKLPIRTGLIPGLALGFFDRKDFHALDELNAGRTGKWSSASHNMRGLLPWESKAIESWFPSEGKLLITAAGGGREVLALESMGYKLEAFECNPRLVEAANEHLANRAFRSRVEVCSRDTAPHLNGLFDGVIVGWGSYTLVMGRDTRIEFLQTLAQKMHEGAPILISYFKLENPRRLADRTQHKIASWIRKMRCAAPLEANDIMDWNLRHRFDDAEIKSELVAAGFEWAYMSDDGYPHAVGIRRSSSND